MQKCLRLHVSSKQVIRSNTKNHAGKHCRHSRPPRSHYTARKENNTIIRTLRKHTGNLCTQHMSQSIVRLFCIPSGPTHARMHRTLNITAVSNFSHLFKQKKNVRSAPLESQRRLAFRCGIFFTFYNWPMGGRSECGRWVSDFRLRHDPWVYRLPRGQLLSQRTVCDTVEVCLWSGVQRPGAGGDLWNSAVVSAAELLDCRGIQPGTAKNGT